MTLGDMTSKIKSRTDELARRITIGVLEQMDKSIKDNQHRKAIVVLLEWMRKHY